MQKICN